MAENKAFIVELNNEKGYQRLIPGAPTTHGMKSGRVYLEPGSDCGVHSTEDKEEQLVFLSGCGTAIIGEEEMTVGAGRTCYIPPQTKHNILNTTSTEPLVYVFCVAPVR
ncbi:MAG: hypothetical protein B6I25_05110 [Planctomycetales bacterium 4572_13]|nr:MAG: hypothetical protein B6I25_05110 [Planctomycetales bacterium 4572_13]